MTFIHSMIACVNGIRLSTVSRDRISNFGISLSNYGIRLSNFGVRIFGYGLRLSTFPYVHDYSLSARAAIAL